MRKLQLILIASTVLSSAAHAELELEYAETPAQLFYQATKTARDLTFIQTKLAAYYALDEQEQNSLPSKDQQQVAALERMLFSFYDLPLSDQAAEVSPLSSNELEASVNDAVILHSSSEFVDSYKYVSEFLRATNAQAIASQHATAKGRVDGNLLASVTQGAWIESKNLAMYAVHMVANGSGYFIATGGKHVAQDFATLASTVFVYLPSGISNYLENIERADSYGRAAYLSSAAVFVFGMPMAGRTLTKVPTAPRLAMQKAQSMVRISAQTSRQIALQLPLQARRIKNVVLLLPDKSAHAISAVRQGWNNALLSNNHRWSSFFSRAGGRSGLPFAYAGARVSRTARSANLTLHNHARPRTNPNIVYLERNGIFANDRRGFFGWWKTGFERNYETSRIPKRGSGNELVKGRAELLKNANADEQRVGSIVLREGLKPTWIYQDAASLPDELNFLKIQEGASQLKVGERIRFYVQKNITDHYETRPYQSLGTRVIAVGEGTVVGLFRQNHRRYDNRVVVQVETKPRLEIRTTGQGEKTREHIKVVSFYDGERPGLVVVDRIGLEHQGQSLLTFRQPIAKYETDIVQLYGNAPYIHIQRMGGATYTK